jgi:hypothetical protein
MAVVARSCILAAAAAAGGQAVARRRTVLDALAYLQAIPGIHGALLVSGEQIGLAGGLELAA